MDETPVTFVVPSNRNFDMKDAGTVSIKKAKMKKMHYIVVLPWCTDGTKLKPIIILKRKTLPKP